MVGVFGETRPERDYDGTLGQSVAVAAPEPEGRLTALFSIRRKFSTPAAMTVCLKLHQYTSVCCDSQRHFELAVARHD